MLILTVIIWFLLLILHKRSYHIFANQFWNQFPYTSCYCVGTYVNFDGNYLIFTHNLTYNVIFIFSRKSSGTSSGISSGTSYSTSPVTVSKLMLILNVIIWFLLLISEKMASSYIREPVLQPVTVQVLLLCRNLC